jgi:AcrR family transcriptional regulator
MPRAREGRARQKILDTAREILATEGQGALTMRRLAHRIEYTPGALYAHFADKDALLRELCSCDFYEFAGQLQGALATEDPIDRLRSLARHYARFGLEHPQQYRILFMMEPVPELSKLKQDRGNPARDGACPSRMPSSAASFRNGRPSSSSWRRPCGAACTASSRSRS